MKIKKLIFAFIGIIIMGFGCGMLIKTGYGADTVNCLITGIANSLNVSVGQATTIFNVVVVIIIFILDKKLIGISMIMSVFLVQYPIDFAISIFPSASNIVLGVICDIASIYIFTLGAAMMICSNYGSSIYDGLIIGISKTLNKKYMVIKYIGDFVCVLIGYLLKGEIGLGTIISLITVGYLMDFHIKNIHKLFKI